ncbi:peroxisomal targeting signal 1 receptor-like [Uloborus diversus]|uniref:peroxisomal targeting signal 1 receptor-like n=1 Tax=Uloborus diversus TaxID=327109 RepID=UPI002409AF12|nr:peroxisomal targeting signal 1 receptor-like [Uloborus diversus]
MAMRDLIDTDCGLSNPLMKVASHYTQEKSHQAGQPSSASASDQLVKEFLLDSNEVERQAPDTFNMEGLLHQMSEIDELYHRSPAQNIQAFSTPNDWVQNYLGSHDIAYENNRLNTLNPLDNTWAEEYLITSEQDIQNQRPLGNAWSQDFKAQSCSEITEIATGLSDSVTDPKISESKFMRFIRKVGDGEVNLEQIEQEKNAASKSVADIWSADFATAWCRPVEGLDEAWESSLQNAKEFKTFTRTEDEKQEEAKNDADFWDNLQKEWEKLAKDENVEHPWLSDYETFDPYKEYTFTNENPFSECNEPFEEGLKKLASGDLPSAVLLFEAAVKKNPEQIEAWQYLGTSQAKNEQDPAAIAAFKRCLELDPDNLTALMALAVSYTNESMQAQACETLIRWLHKNPKYSHLVESTHLDDTSSVSSILSSEKHKAARDMFIAAARINPTNPDPDIQNGLGVLFNLSGDYDKAIDCFRAALQVKPDDSLLWNRVGATLANSNRSGEAIEAYYRALELYPGFIRSRFNLGISCINLGAVKEAAEHFLLALNLQNAGRGPQGLRSKAAMSSNIWSILRTVMTLLKRPDLYEAIDRKDLDLLNKEFGMEP